MSTRVREGGAYRLVFFLLVVLGSFVAVAFRLATLQAVEAKKFDGLALRQRVRRVELAPNRGTVFDRNGEELAVSIGVDSIYATPYLVEDPEEAANRLSGVLGLERDVVLEKLKRKSGFVYLARKVDKERSQAVRDLGIEGIGVLEESKRFYPCSSLGSQLIGFAGAENRGLAGLELGLDRILRGRPGQLVMEKDPLGHSIPGGILFTSPSTDGNNVYLTIDKAVQYKAEAELKAAVEQSKARAGTIIVMDPRDGAILAMASYPRFDLNAFNKASPDEMRNRALTDVYEPGSTMKVVVAAAALEEKLVNPRTLFHLQPTITVSNKTIKEAHERPAVDYTFTEIISHSSNVGAVTLGLKLGKERLYKYIKSFGLTEETGVDFPGEVSGFMPKPEHWSGTTIATVPIGQGVAVTAMQMLRVVAAVANGGVLVEPRLFSRATDASGKEISLAPGVSGKRVVSRETAEALREILSVAVADGTGTGAQIPGYRVAGKTGTAQKPKENGRGYQVGRYVASFVGFAPVEDPRIAAIVMMDEPKTAIWGGVVAAPAFRNTVEFSLRHLKIAPKIAN
jgi:cell division protein FtsI (penicillin-binding protein 3)